MNERSLSKEQLDDLSLRGEQLNHALRSLAWINRWFGNTRSAISIIEKLHPDKNSPLKLTDLGCGGGDVALAIGQALRKKGIPFSITGIDGNEHTLAIARSVCAACPEIRFEKADILDPGFSLDACDILFSSHFMYHFREEALVSFLQKNRAAVSTAFICNELERSSVALRLFSWFAFLFPISRMARQDGQLAIRRSFTKKEWIALFEKAGIAHYRIRRVPLFRLQVTIFPRQTR